MGIQGRDMTITYQKFEPEQASVVAQPPGVAHSAEQKLLKLVVQIPCYNEEQTLPYVVAGIPREIDGIDRVLIQVIDDGSTDNTVEVAKSLGVDSVIQQKSNKGLAKSFQVGIESALAAGGDIIVNTDGDNQYCGSSISDLVRPIVEGKADIALGDRNPSANQEFSKTKRLLQRFGSSVIRRLAGIDAGDAVTGFRAYSRDAALQINVMTKFSYTIETLIHAGRQGLTIKSVPVRTNSATRPSRLFKSTFQFIRKQAITVLRSCVMYMPLRTFLLAGLVMLAIGAAPILRFLYFYALGEGDGHIQSLVIGGVFLMAGYMTVVVAFLSDTISTNRRLAEATLTRVRKLELALSAKVEPSECGSHVVD